MSRGTIAIEQFGTCHAEGCDAVAPWDMPAIGINDTHVFCSPSCAYGFLDATAEPLEVVSLHDPQYHAERPDGVGEDAITIWREVHGKADAFYTVWQLKEMHDGPFRV